MLNLQSLPNDAIKQYLQEAKRAELQSLFKRYGLKGANQKSELLIKALLEHVLQLKAASEDASNKPPSTPEASATKPSGIPKSVRRNLLDSPFVPLNAVEAPGKSEQEAIINKLKVRIAELEEQLAAIAMQAAEAEEVRSPSQHRVEASADSDPGEVKIAEKREISRASSPEPQKDAEKAASSSTDHWLSTIFRNPLTPASTPVKSLANISKAKVPQTEPAQHNKKALPRRLSLIKATAAMTLSSPAAPFVASPKNEKVERQASFFDVSSSLRQALTSEPSPPLAGLGWLQPSA